MTVPSRDGNSADMTETFRDNASLRRFELAIDSDVAFVRYTRAPGIVTLVHTEVPEALGGRGVGGRLARLALEAVRSEGAKVVPVCPFIAAWMKKHPEFDDLRA